MKQDPTSALYQRVTGYLPLSIATALAFQEFLGYEVNDDQTLKSKLKNPASKQHHHIWLNVSTLLRNFLGSMEGESYLTVATGAIAAEFISEVQRTAVVIHDHVPNTTLTFYKADYVDNPKRYPHAKLRVSTTPKQLAYKDVTDRVFKAINPTLLDIPSVMDKVFYRHFHNQITPGGYPGGKTVMLTHYPLDLLSQYYFSDLSLLESHTGKLKPRTQWHSKLLNGKDLVQIPFNETTLQIFGDSETFSPQAITMRRTLVELAKTHNWSSITTKDRIRGQVKLYVPSPLKEDILKFF